MVIAATDIRTGDVIEFSLPQSTATQWRVTMVGRDDAGQVVVMLQDGRNDLTAVVAIATDVRLSVCSRQCTECGRDHHPGVACTDPFAAMPPAAHGVSWDWDPDGKWRRMTGTSYYPGDCDLAEFRARAEFLRSD